MTTITDPEATPAVRSTFLPMAACCRTGRPGRRSRGNRPALPRCTTRPPARSPNRSRWHLKVTPPRSFRRRPRRSRRGGMPLWPDGPRSCSGSGVAQRPQARGRRDHHQRARQGPVRRARRDHPRPGSCRAGLRSPAPAQGQPDRERLDQGRRVLHPTAAGRRRGHLPVQLPGHGADVVLPHRDRRGQHGGAQAEREGPVDGELAGRPVEGSRPAGRCVQCAARRQGRGGCVADRSRVKAISFVGSTPIAQYVYETGTAHGKRVQALGGAKNHMLVLPDADLDLAADAAVNAGFGTAGERCMAISALVAVDSVADELIGKITERMATLRTGDGRRGCDMGPLVTGAHRDKVSGYVDAGVAEGAELVVDGRSSNPDQHFDGGQDGFWLAPTLFDKVTPDMSIYTDEIFGPVLGVVRVESLQRGFGADQQQPVRQRHGDLHQRRRRRPPLPERGPGRHDRHQRARPGAGRLLQLRRVESRPCSATPTPTAPKVSTSTPAAKSSPPAGSTPATAASTSASPRTTERRCTGNAIVSRTRTMHARY